MSLPDDELIASIRKELVKLKQKNNLVDYIVIIMELYDKEKKVIDETLQTLDARTSSKIRNVIRKLKRKKLTSGYSLNEFYGEV